MSNEVEFDRSTWLRIRIVAHILFYDGDSKVLFQVFELGDNYTLQNFQNCCDKPLTNDEFDAIACNSSSFIPWFAFIPTTYTLSTASCSFDASSVTFAPILDQPSVNSIV